MLRFEEIDDKYCNQYIEMLQECKASNTSLTPDILEIPCNNETEYRNIVRTAKNAAIGIHEDRDWYEKCNYYLVVNDQDKLIGIGEGILRWRDNERQRKIHRITEEAE